MEIGLGGEISPVGEGFPIPGIRMKEPGHDYNNTRGKGVAEKMRGEVEEDWNNVRKMRRTIRKAGQNGR